MRAGASKVGQGLVMMGTHVPGVKAFLPQTEILMALAFKVED